MGNVSIFGQNNTFFCVIFSFTWLRSAFDQKNKKKIESLEIIYTPTVLILRV